MKLVLEKLKGGFLEADVDGSTSIFYLKKLIEVKEGRDAYPFESQLIMIGGRPLDDRTILSDMNLTVEDKLVLCNKDHDFQPPPHPVEEDPRIGISSMSHSLAMTTRPMAAERQPMPLPESHQQQEDDDDDEDDGEGDEEGDDVINESAVKKVLSLSRNSWDRDIIVRVLEATGGDVQQTALYLNNLASQQQQQEQQRLSLNLTSSMGFMTPFGHQGANSLPGDASGGLGPELEARPLGDMNSPLSVGMKRPVGRPRKSVEKQPRKRGPYNRWFAPDLWKPIEEAMARFRNIKDALTHLKNEHRAPDGSPGPYENLARSTMYEWFTPTGDMLPKAHRARDQTSVVVSEISPTILDSFPDLIEECKDAVTALKASGQNITVPTVKPLLTALLQMRAPQALEKLPSHILTSQTVKDFLRQHLGYRFKRLALPQTPLPPDYPRLGKYLTFRTAYLAFAYQIPPSLVVNSDEVVFYMIPHSGEKTWATLDEVMTEVVGGDDKRQVAAMISSSMEGSLLPMQVIYDGKTLKSMATGAGASAASSLNFHLTHSPNHSSSLHTLCDFVEKILFPYFQREIARLGLPGFQKMVWLIDCVGTHINHDFMQWCKINHGSWLFVLYVPTNCTAKFQPTDVVLARTLNHCLADSFVEWAVEEYLAQLRAGCAPSALKLDMSIRSLRDMCTMWLVKAWQRVGERKELVRKGWEKCGLLAAYNIKYQIEAARLSLEDHLFSGDYVNEDTSLQHAVFHMEEDDASLDDVFQACLRDSGEGSAAGTLTLMHSQTQGQGPGDDRGQRQDPGQRNMQGHMQGGFDLINMASTHAYSDREMVVGHVHGHGVIEGQRRVMVMGVGAGESISVTGIGALVHQNKQIMGLGRKEGDIVDESHELENEADIVMDL